MNHWQLIKNKALEFLQEGTVWKSFVFDKPYRVLKVEENEILIEKVNLRNPGIQRGYPVSLTEKIVLSALKKIENIAISGKDALTTSVAREVAIVTLHPFISWNPNTKKIVWNNPSIATIEQTSNFIKNAPDDELNRIEKLVNQRRFQSIFRQNLLQLYNNTCAVSAISTVEVLEASHISDHSEDGNNSNENGILLRADLHILFDKKLLLIHPDKLTVHLDPAIHDSAYKEYMNKKLRPRTDKSRPSKIFLSEKWNSVSWTGLIK